MIDLFINIFTSSIWILITYLFLLVVNEDRSDSIINALLIIIGLSGVVLIWL